jgi:hypothetical protein
MSVHGCETAGMVNIYRGGVRSTVLRRLRRAIRARRKPRRTFGIAGPVIIATMLIFVLGMALYVALFL